MKTQNPPELDGEARPALTLFPKQPDKYSIEPPLRQGNALNFPRKILKYCARAIVYGKISVVFVKEVTALPNKKSAKKRVLVTERNRIYNRFWKTRCKNAVKKLLEAVESKDLELATKRLNEAQSVLDKAVVKGVVHRNTAARRKASITAKVKALSA